MLTPPAIDEMFTPLKACARVALAVSGGGDSMALMLLAHEWHERTPDAPELVVLTVDHGLRPEARHEAAWVGQQAGARGLPHHDLRWANARPDASQANARAARYGLMAHCARARGLEAIVTAHTRDDVAETFLMRLARGSGIDGLAAMARETAWDGIRILRPLLDVSRAQLRAALETRGASWIEDPSNAEDRFERVRVRQALDTLAGLGVTRGSIVESAQRLRRARTAIEAEARAFIADHARISPAGYLQCDGHALANAPEEVSIHALQHILQAIGGRAGAPRLRKLETLSADIRRRDPLTATLAGCVIVRDPDRGTLTICREPGRLRADPVTVAPGETAIWDRRFRVEMSADAQAPVRIEALGEANLPALPDAVRSAHPRAALASLPAIYEGRALLGVPVPGFALAEQDAAAAMCRAAFIWHPYGTPLP